MDDDSKTSFPHWFKWVGSFLSVFILIAIFTYFYHFARNGFGDPEEFAWFGDYLGGLITPILTFFTICLLVWSIHIQLLEFRLTREEMRNTRKELAQTAKAQSDSYDLQLVVNKQAQLVSSINHLYSDFIKISLNRIPSFSITFDKFLEIKTNSKFNIEHLSFMTQEEYTLIMTEVNNVRESKETPITAASESFIQIVRICTAICNITHELYSYTYSSNIAIYHRQKAQLINEKLLRAELITEQEFVRNEILLKRPKKLKI